LRLAGLLVARLLPWLPRAPARELPSCPGERTPRRLRPARALPLQRIVTDDLWEREGSPCSAGAADVGVLSSVAFFGPSSSRTGDSRNMKWPTLIGSRAYVVPNARATC